MVHKGSGSKRLFYMVRVFYIGRSKPEWPEIDFVAITRDDGLDGSFGDWAWDWNGPYPDADAARWAAIQLYGPVSRIGHNEAGFLLDGPKLNLELVEAYQLGRHQQAS